MLLQLNFTNPNKKISVMFEKVSVKILFTDEMIATQGILPFSLRNNTTRLQTIHLVAKPIFLPINDMVELRRQVTSNMIEYEIISRFRVKVVIGYINYSYWLKGSCQLQLTSPPADDLLSRKYTLQKYDEECMMGDIYINIDI